MPLTRHDIEARERETLRPYAQLSLDTRGREYSEVSPEWRSEYQRDRDRITHSRAFRRLEYKTQVFLNGSGDHIRTRLTHTMEVTAISRNIARALGLNEDLTEAIALAHDLGHSPFGHSGEEALNRLMSDYGGFEHNAQSMRVIESLERKYPTFPGLNLSWEVREGLCKHRSAHSEAVLSQLEFDSHQPSLEAQVADLADEIAYYSHDLDDGLDSGLLSQDELSTAIPIWSRAEATVDGSGTTPDPDIRRFYIIRCIIDEQVERVLKHSESQLAAAGVYSANDVRRYPKSLIGYDEALRKENTQLRAYLYKNLYYSPEVHEPNQRAVQCLEVLFKRIEELEPSLPKRELCDRLASMTDRSALSEYQRYTGHSPELSPRSA